MEFLPVVAMTTLTLKLVDFIRYLRAGDINGVTTQLAAWLAGVLVVFLVAQTAWAAGIAVGDMRLSTLGLWSQVFVGLTASSGAGFLNDIRKAVDNTTTAAIPRLIPRRGRHNADVS